MNKRDIRLSNGEVDLMNLLWQHGALTLAAAHQTFISQSDGDVGYTTIQTRLNRLVEKGYAEKSGRPAEYRATLKRSDVQAGHLDDLLSRLAGGSIVPLVAHLVQDQAIDDDELAALKDLVDEATKDQDRLKKQRAADSRKSKSKTQKSIKGESAQGGGSK